jgi:hypothetical protein
VTILEYIGQINDTELVFLILLKMALYLQRFTLIDTTPVYFSGPISHKSFLDIELNLPILNAFLRREPSKIDGEFVLFACFEHIYHVGHLIGRGLFVV